MPDARPLIVLGVIAAAMIAVGGLPAQLVLLFGVWVVRALFYSSVAAVTVRAIVLVAAWGMQRTMTWRMPVARRLGETTR